MSIGAARESVYAVAQALADSALRIRDTAAQEPEAALEEASNCLRLLLEAEEAIQALQRAEEG